MAEPTRTERDDAAELAAKARERGMEQLEGAKGQLAEGAERVAAAVERTAEELESDGDDTISGVGRSLASMMRQLAGGLRERDVDQFASELGHLARSNPGVFLAGSVALGFGIARFFKARSPHARRQGDASWRTGSPRSDIDERYDMDSDESVDLSDQTTETSLHGEGDTGLDTRTRTDQTASGSATPSAARSSGGSPAATESTSGASATDEGRTPSKARAGAKSKAKPQRASASERQASREEPYQAPLGTAPTSGGSDGESAFTGGVGSGPLQGGKDS
jgi:hypothetical protein